MQSRMGVWDRLIYAEKYYVFRDEIPYLQKENQTTTVKQKRFFGV